MPSRALLSTPNPNSVLHSRILLLTLIFTASALFLFALFIFLFYLYYTLINRSKTSPFDSNTELKLQEYSYRELKSATNSFNESNYIGKGGSGTVYRGILRDGKSVAVKKLDSSSLQSDREFQNELQILGGLRSQYVVSLLGYCVEKKKRFLVYEFMPNKSLQESLFAAEDLLVVGGGSCLDWDKRFEIILDIAKALSFLHLDCDPPIIHGDVKPSNVLLGFDYRAKISDFGLSRIKTEGEFGVDLFSQELGRSEELLRSQDLSANLPEIKMGGNQVDNITSSTTEVDFSLALQASSSNSFYSKNNRIDYNVKPSNLNSWNIQNGDCGNMDDSKRCGSKKGKEICKFVPDDEELCSIDHSKELTYMSSSLPIDDPIDDTMQWGKDWWWRQDGSGELCSKDYVTEWIGSQICPSSNPDWDEEKKISPVKPNLDDSTQLDKSDAAKKKSKFVELGCKPSKKRSKKNDEKGIKSCNKKQRKMQEWWKEENLAELSKKGNKLRKIEAKWRKGFKIQNLNLGRRFPFRKSSARSEQNQIESGSNVDFSFRKGWKKKNSHSGASEMWSGDLFSRELSSTTSMRGTVCYVAPEYGGCGYLMEKADIYSLGVLILVIVSGRRPLHVLNSPMKLEKANLINWCRQLAQSGNILELVDERLKDEYDKEQASLCINLALRCLKKMPELRPDIGEIVKILKGEMDLLGVPFEFSPSPPSRLFSRSRRRAKTDVE